MLLAAVIMVLARTAAAPPPASFARVAAATVTRTEPPADDYWTPERMRSAKPLPMPAARGAPLAPQPSPPAYTEPPGSTPGGQGSAARP